MNSFSIPPLGAPLKNNIIIKTTNQSRLERPASRTEFHSDPFAESSAAHNLPRHHELFESLVDRFRFLRTDKTSSSGNELSTQARVRLSQAIDQAELNAEPASWDELTPELKNEFRREGAFYELSSYTKFGHYLRTEQGQAWLRNQLSELQEVPFDEELVGAIYSNDTVWADPKRKDYLKTLPAEMLQHIAVESSILAVGNRDYPVLLAENLPQVTEQCRTYALQEIRNQLVDVTNIDSALDVPTELADYPKAIAARVLATDYSLELPMAIPDIETAGEAYRDILATMPEDFQETADGLNYSSNTIHTVFPKYLAEELKLRFTQIQGEQVKDIVQSEKRDSYQGGYTLPVGLDFSAEHGRPYDNFTALRRMRADGAIFRGATFPGTIDLSGAEIGEGVFDGLTSYPGAKLGIEAHVSSWVGANLQTPNISGLDLQRSNLERLNISDLETPKNGHYWSVDISGAKLPQASIKGKLVTDGSREFAAVIRLKARDAEFTNTELSWLDLSNSDFRRAKLGDVVIGGRQSSLFGKGDHNATVTYVCFDGSDFVDANLADLKSVSCTFRRANFLGPKTTLDNIDLDNLPHKSEVNAQSEDHPFYGAKWHDGILMPKKLKEQLEIVGVKYRKGGKGNEYDVPDFYKVRNETGVNQSQAAEEAANQITGESLAK